MKSMFQKVGFVLTVFALILLCAFNAHSQTCSIVIIDDMSGLKKKVINPVLQAQGVKVQGDSTTFKGVVSGVNQVSVQIEIREIGTQALKVSASGPIANRAYAIPNVNISMLTLDQYYTLTIRFLGVNAPLSGSVRFRRSSGIATASNGVNNN